jgi:hypothetical protein
VVCVPNGCGNFVMLRTVSGKTAFAAICFILGLMRGEEVRDLIDLQDFKV